MEALKIENGSAPPAVITAQVEVPCPGESVSGDAALTIVTAGRTLLAAIDGAGHGEAAAVAARLAATALRRHADRPMEEQLRACHEALRLTRGAALSLVHLEHGSRCLRWVGIGDVLAVILPAFTRGQKRLHRLVSSSGILGYRALPRVKVQTLEFLPGDLLVLATDGLRPELADALESGALGGAARLPRGAGAPVRHALRHLGVQLMNRYRKGSDDALVLLASIEIPAPRESARRPGP